jgi:hypothetical protein
VRLAIALIAARDQVDVARDFPDDAAPAWSEFEQYMLTHCPPRDSQRRAVTEWGELKLPVSMNGNEAAIHSFGQSVLQLMHDMGDRAPVSAVGALQLYITNLHPELKKFVWDKYCESGQQWEGNLSDWIPKAYLQGHTLFSGGAMVEYRGLAQKRPLADAAASLALGEHASAKGTGPTPAVGMRQSEQQPPKDLRIPKQLDPVAHNEKAYPDDSDSRTFSSELAHALMSEQRCLYCWRIGHYVERCHKLERVRRSPLPCAMARNLPKFQQSRIQISRTCAIVLLLCSKCTTVCTIVLLRCSQCTIRPLETMML